MKYYLIFGTSVQGYSTAAIRAQNKYDAIKEARRCCPHDQYIPVLVKRISKKMYYFICEINKKEE